MVNRPKITNIILTTSIVEVAKEKSNRKLLSFFNNGEVDIQVYTSSSEGDKWTLPSGACLPFDHYNGQGYFYAKAGSGTCAIEILEVLS